MKILNGVELTEYIQDRQAKQVRALRQAHHVIPRLVILQATSETSINKYVEQLKNYGTEILVETGVLKNSDAELPNSIKLLNTDTTVHGIFTLNTAYSKESLDKLVDSISVNKDVSGTSQNATFDSATSLAVDWLLAGYNVDLRGKHIVIVGYESAEVLLLAKRWRTSELEVVVVNPENDNLAEITLSADILVSVANRANLIKPDLIKPNVVIIDAGFSVGDVAPEVYELPNITITPAGEGITTIKICALFDNVIQSAGKTIEASE